MAFKVASHSGTGSARTGSSDSESPPEQQFTSSSTARGVDVAGRPAAASERLGPQACQAKDFESEGNLKGPGGGGAAALSPSP